MSETLQVVSVLIDSGVFLIAMLALRAWRKESIYNHKNALFNDLANRYYDYHEAILKLLSELRFIQMYLATDKKISPMFHQDTLNKLEAADGLKIQIIFQNIEELKAKLNFADFKMKLFDEKNQNIISKNIINLIAIFTKIKTTSEFVTFGDWFYSQPFAEIQIKEFETMDTDSIKDQTLKELSNFQDTLAKLYKKI